MRMLNETYTAGRPTWSGRRAGLASRLLAGAALGLTAMLTGQAGAQSTPEISWSPTSSTVSAASNPTISIKVPNQSGTLVQIVNASAVWEASGTTCGTTDFPCPCSGHPTGSHTPFITYQAVTPSDGIYGYDLTYTYLNEGEGSVTAHLGAPVLTVNITDAFNFTKIRDFVWPSGLGQELDAGSRGGVYPGNQYAPVTVVRGTVGEETYVIAASIQYPVLKYKHRVSVYPAVFASPTAYLKFGFFLNPCSDQVLGMNNHDGVVFYEPSADTLGANDEARVYTVSVRFAKESDLPSLPLGSNGWLALLEPYRNYFQSHYGAPRYERNATPIRGFNLARLDCTASATSNSCDDNPSCVGFDCNPFRFQSITWSGSTWRPDTLGWQGFAARWIEGGYDNGWPRTMIWAVSGAYPGPHEISLNHFYQAPGKCDYAFNFATHLSEFQTDISYFEEFVHYATGMGFWWGRSVQPQAAWGDGSVSEHWLGLGADSQSCNDRSYAFAELDAVRTYSEAFNPGHAQPLNIGLDQFGLKPWDGYVWLQTLKLNYPKYRFLTEPTVSDFLHVVAPTFYIRNPSGGGVPENQPNVLADYLIPGHETILQISDFDTGDGSSSSPLGQELQAAAVSGFVPLYLGAVNGADFFIGYTEQDYEAKESWTTSVPAALQATRWPIITSVSFTGAPSNSETVTLKVTATLQGESSCEGCSYQWHKVTMSSDLRITDSKIEDAVYAIYVNESFSEPGDIGWYYCVVSAPVTGACAESAAVRLDPCQVADVNDDGELTFFDLNDFITTYYYVIEFNDNRPLQDGPRTDMNRDGVVDFQDLNLFYTMYYGCVE